MGDNSYSRGTNVYVGNWIVDGTSGGSIIHSQANVTVESNINDELNDFGNIAIFQVVNGGTVVSKLGFLGNTNGTVGIAHVDGDGSLWRNSANLTVGGSGLGALVITNAGVVTDTNGTVGIANASLPGFSSAAVIDGTGSNWKNNGAVFVGVGGDAYMNVTNGGLVNSTFGEIASLAGTNANVTVSDAGSAWVINGNLNVANDGNGNLTIVNGGLVKAQTVTLAVNADAISNLEFDTQGTLSANVVIGGAGASNVIFNGGIPVCAEVTATSPRASVRLKSNRRAPLLTAMASISPINSILEGDGGLTKLGSKVLTPSAANTFTGDTFITGGTLTLTNSLGLQNSTLNYDIVGGAINFSTLTNATLGGLAGDKNLDLSNGANGAIALFVGNNGNSTTYSGALTDLGNHGGSITKIGGGILTLTGTSSYTSATTVLDGFINFSANVNLGTGNIVLQGGGLQWATDTSTDVSSRLVLNEGFDSLDTNGNDVSFASGLHGAGSLFKTGSGTLTLGGTNDYSGDTFIGQGALTVGANTSLIGSSNIYVGSDGLDPALYVIGGGNVSTDMVQIGVSGFGSVLVSDAGSTLSASSLYVGAGSCANLTIANGGNVSSTDVVVGWYSTGSVTVTDNGSVLSSTDEVDVGVHGNSGTVTVTNNATANFSFLELGESGSATGTLNIGNGATVTIGELYLANNFCTTANVNINAGGTLAIDGDGGISVGDGSYSFRINGGTLQVFDVGLTTCIDITLACGNIATIDTNGLDSSLYGVLSGSGVLQKAGAGNLTLTNVETYTGGTNVLGGTLIVDGGTINHANGDLYVGNATETAAFVAQNNATVTVAEFSMGNPVGSYDTATINTSTLYVENGALIVGVHGTANLTANNGSTINLDSAGNHGVSLYVGEHSSANGTVTITDSGTTLNSNGSIIVGFHGTGSFTLANGAQVNVNGDDVASNGFVLGVLGTGIANITGAGSNLTVNAGALAVGYLNDGTMNISDGAKVKTYGVNHGGATVELGFAANSSLTVTNATLSTHNGSIMVGDAGNATLTVDAGSVYSHGTDGNNSLIVGNEEGSSGNVFIGLNGDGAHYNSFAGALVVGNSGVGNLTIDSNADLKSYGTDSANHALLIGNGADSTGFVDVLGYMGIRNGNVTVGNFGNGTLTVDNGGYASVSNGNVLLLASDANANATVNLNAGGTLSVGGTNGIQAGSGSYNFNLNGGTLRVHGGDLTTSVNFALGNNTTSSINTNGYNATINGTLSGQGGIAKDGNGTLTLNANNSFTGATNVNTGNLVVNGPYASSIVVNGGTSVLGGNGTINGNVSLANGAVVAPGIANLVTGNVASGLATTTITGNLVWNVTATLLPWHLSSTDNTSDTLNVLGNVTNPGSLDTIIFDFNNTGYFNGPTTYTLITSANDMSNAGFNISQFQAVNIAGGLFDAANQSHFLFTGTSLEFVVVPEPSTWGLLAGGAMLLMALRRKRNLVKA